MTISAHRTTIVLFALFFVLFMTFAFLAIAKFMAARNNVQNLNVQRVGGVLGILDGTFHFLMYINMIFEWCIYT